MNSNVIGSYLSNFEKQLKTQKKLEPIDIQTYQRSILNDRRPDTLIIDDTPRTNIQNRYSRIGLNEYGRNSNSGKEVFLNEVSLYSNGEKDPRGWTEGPLMEKIKVYSYQNAPRIKSSLFKGDGQGGVQEQIPYLQFLEHQDQAREYSKKYMNIFSDEIITYNPTKMSNQSDQDAINLKFQTDQMTAQQQGTQNRRTLQNFGIQGKNNTDMFIKSEPDHKLLVADYSQVYLNNPKMDPKNYENVIEQFNTQKQLFEENTLPIIKDVKGLLYNNQQKQNKDKKKITSQKEDKQLIQVFENLMNNSKQIHQNNQKQQISKFAQNDILKQNTVYNVQNKNAVSLLEQFQSIDPYNQKVKSLLDRANQVGFDNKTIIKISLQPRDSRQILNLFVLEKFLDFVVQNKNNKKMKQSDFQQINFQQQYEKLIQDICDNYQKQTKMQQFNADMSQINNRTAQTSSIYNQDSTILSDKIQNKTQLRMMVQDLMKKQNLTVDYLQNLSESFQGIKYSGQVKGLDSSDVINNQILHQHLLHNQDTVKQNSMLTAKYNMPYQDISQINNLAPQQQQNIVEKFNVKTLNNSRRQYPQQTIKTQYDDQQSDIDMLHYR